MVRSPQKRRASIDTNTAQLVVKHLYPFPNGNRLKDYDISIDANLSATILVNIYCWHCTDFIK